MRKSQVIFAKIFFEIVLAFDTGNSTLLDMETTEHTLELEIRDGIDIEVEVDWEWENDSIGAYEYWGARCVDKGHTYAVPSSIYWDKTGFTKEEIDFIEKEIDKALAGWSRQVKKSEPDYDDIGD